MEEGERTLFGLGWCLNSLSPNRSPHASPRAKELPTPDAACAFLISSLTRPPATWAQNLKTNQRLLPPHGDGDDGEWRRRYVLTRILTFLFG